MMLKFGIKENPTGPTASGLISITTPDSLDSGWKTGLISITGPSGLDSGNLQSDLFTARKAVAAKGTPTLDRLQLLSLGTSNFAT